MPITKNLKPVKNRAEATKLGRRAGIALGVARGEKILSEALLTQIMKKVPTGKTVAEHLAEALILSALGGNVQAMAHILDRTEGKVAQQVQVEENTSIAQALLGARKRLREL